MWTGLESLILPFLAPFLAHDDADAASTDPRPSMAALKTSAASLIKETVGSEPNLASHSSSNFAVTLIRRTN